MTIDARAPARGLLAPSGHLLTVTCGDTRDVDDDDGIDDDDSDDGDDDDVSEADTEVTTDNKRSRQA